MALLSASLYYKLHLLFVLVLTIIECYLISRRNNNQLLYSKYNSWPILLYAFLFTIIVGLRPISAQYFGDTANYALIYERYQDGLLDVNSTAEGDWLWNRFMFACSQVMAVPYFFLIVEILYVIPLIIACKRWSANNMSVMLLFAMAAFSFFSYGTNGIRNGMACSLVVLALTFIDGSKWEKIICAILCFIAITTHKSTALPVLAMVFTAIYRKPKPMFVFWFLSIIISLLAGSAVSNFFESLGFDDRMTSYLDTSDDELMAQFSRTGFRWDFLLYSMAPIVLGWYVIFKRRVWDKKYLLMLGTYIYSNAFWIMVIRSAFSNRFAYLSWFLYPFVLAYPLLRLNIMPNQGRRLCVIIMLAHLSFTLLMYFL